MADLQSIQKIDLTYIQVHDAISFIVVLYQVASNYVVGLACVTFKGSIISQTGITSCQLIWQNIDGFMRIL
jgi:hypothetical protein